MHTKLFKLYSRVLLYRWKNMTVKISVKRPLDAESRWDELKRRLKQLLRECLKC